MNRRRDEAAMLQIVHRVERYAQPLGLGIDRLVHRPIVGCGNREPGAREIAPAIGPAPYLDRAPPREVRQASQEIRAHNRHVGAGRHQATHLLLRHRAAADHHGAPAAQVEKDRVERAHWITGRAERSASTPTRSQKSPNRSSASRSSRNRSNSGRTVATSRSRGTRSAYCVPSRVPSILPPTNTAYLLSERPTKARSAV